MALSVDKGQPRRRQRRVNWFWVVLFLLALGAGGWAAVTRPWEPKPLPVAVETVAPGPESRVLAVNGRIEPDRQVEISSTVSGRVAAVGADEGDTVLAGALLLEIDDSQQRAVVAQAASSLDSAMAKLQQAQVDYERAKGLGDSISRKALDDAQLAVQTAQTDVQRLTATRDQATSLLAEYQVKAPFDGTVLSRGADPGQVVNNSTALFLFAELSVLRAEASVDELYSAEIRRGLRVKAQPSGHSRVLDGEVAYISPRVDTQTGGRLVRVSLPDAAALSLPVGLTVTINIVVDELDSAITIPRSALLQNAVTPAVYVLEGGKAVRREVQFVDWPSDRLIATSGLKAGDVLIVDASKLSDGALVKAKE